MTTRSTISQCNLAQLNTLYRLTGRKEIKRFRGSDRKLAALVRAEFAAYDRLTTRDWIRIMSRVAS